MFNSYRIRFMDNHEATYHRDVTMQRIGLDVLEHGKIKSVVRLDETGKEIL